MRPTARRREAPLVALWAAVVAFPVAGGCGGEPGPDCAAVTTVWEGDAEAFFVTYCATCHSQSLAGEDRQDAPVSVNFDVYSDIVGVGPAYVRDQIEGPMPPPGELQPGAAERARIIDWLACGAQER